MPLKGSTFLASLPENPSAAREEAIFQAARAFLVDWGSLVPVTSGRVRFFVSPDYLSIGTLEDFARMPMAAITAQRLADALGFRLPTPLMVDRIWQAGDVRLSLHSIGEFEPAAMGTKLQMTTSRYVKHQARVEQERAGRRGLVVGHAKDVVRSNLLANPTHGPAGGPRVIIYGAHHAPPALATDQTPKTNGLHVIQGESDFHESNATGYVDYSHGVRPCADVTIVDPDTPSARAMQLDDVLSDPALAPFVNHNGVLLAGGRRYPTGGAGGSVAGLLPSVPPFFPTSPGDGGGASVGTLIVVGASLAGLGWLAWRQLHGRGVPVRLHW